MNSQRFDSLDIHDVIIVGAGPAGLGCAAALKECGIEDIVILDRRGVGAAFAAWPAQMRLISPSFHSNPFGQPDLNAITPHTSPADFLHSEHPTGSEYADYLRAVATHYELDIWTGITVSAVEKSRSSLEVTTDCGLFRARHVIWAAGEFFFPREGEIEGEDLCVHNSAVDDWTKLPGVEHAVIGGFESGIDAAIHLARAGKSVHVLSRGEPWHHDSTDPSRMLSPFTRDRLKDVFLSAPGTIRFYRNADIAKVVKREDRYLIVDREDEPFEISTPPILCTGFSGGLGPVSHYFEDEAGQPIFTEEADESPTLSGLFYSGPMLQHRESLFCFIYKYRGRFGVVAREIAKRLGHDWETPLQQWRERGFLIEDLSCCDDCVCAVENDAPAETAPIEDFATAAR